jgi:hypothetical protein
VATEVAASTPAFMKLRLLRYICSGVISLLCGSDCFFIACSLFQKDAFTVGPPAMIDTTKLRGIKKTQATSVSIRKKVNQYLQSFHRVMLNLFQHLLSTLVEIDPEMNSG